MIKFRVSPPQADKFQKTGFTLLEVSVAVLIMSIVLVSVYKLHSQSIAMNTETRFYTQAPMLAQKVSDEKGMEVSRTSLKTRNELNAPDSWELSVLKQFEQRKAEGEPVKTIEYSETTTHNGNRVFRYMKAIPTDDVCLMCHGKQIPPGITARISELYPNDQATGFSRGDIRGAFSVVKVLD